jgi:hypothetical protein
MDALGAYLVTELIKALGEGNLMKAGAFFAIFAILWWEIRSVKKSIESLNHTISTGFNAGELRFLEIEKIQKKHGDRLSELELHLKGV